MGHYRIIIKKTARKDLKKHKGSDNKKNLIKISKIIEELKSHPYTGTGKPEPLKYELKGLWFRGSIKETDWFTKWLKEK